MHWPDLQGTAPCACDNRTCERVLVRPHAAALRRREHDLGARQQGQLRQVDPARVDLLADGRAAALWGVHGEGAGFKSTVSDRRCKGCNATGSCTYGTSQRLGHTRV